MYDIASIYKAKSVDDAIAALQADGFYDVHIVVRQLLEILGDDRLFFQFLYLVKQMDQCLIDDFSVIHSSSPFRLFCPF